MNEFWTGIVVGGGAVVLVEILVCLYILMTNDYSK